MNSVLIVNFKHNHRYNRKADKFVRIRVDSYDGKVHRLFDVKSFLNYFGVERGNSALERFYRSGKDVFTKRYRSGFKIQIFEI